MGNSTSSINQNFRVSQKFYSKLGYYQNNDIPHPLVYTDKNHQPIFKAARKYLTNILDSIGSVDYRLRQSVMSPDVGGKDSLDSLQSKSRKEYILYFLKLLYFALTIEEDKLSTWTDIYNVVMILKNNQNDKEIITYINQFFMICCTQKVCLYSASSESFFLEEFLKLSTVGKHRALLQPSEVGRMCAKIKYLIRAVVLANTSQILSNDNDITLVTSSNNSVKISKSELTARCKIKSGNDNVITKIANIKRLASFFSGNQVKMPKVLFTDDDECDEAQVGTLIVNIENLTNVVNHCERKLYSEINSLFKGFPTPDFTELKDDLQSSLNGYHIGCTKNYGAKFLTYLSRSDFKNYDGNTTSWNSNYMTYYVKVFDSIMNYLLVLTQVVSGQPARMEELITSRFCNSLDNQRTLYFVDNRIVNVIDYNKTGQKYVARYMTSMSSKLMLLVQLVLRPVYSLFQTLLNNHKPSEMLFLCNGVGMKADRARKTFSTVFAEANPGINLGNHRIIFLQFYTTVFWFILYMCDLIKKKCIKLLSFE